MICKNDVCYARYSQYHLFFIYSLHDTIQLDWLCVIVFILPEP
jgi:hypothetical protein